MEIGDKPPIIVQFIIISQCFSPVNIFFEKIGKTRKKSLRAGIFIFLSPINDTKIHKSFLCRYKTLYFFGSRVLPASQRGTAAKRCLRREKSESRTLQSAPAETKNSFFRFFLKKPLTKPPADDIMPHVARRKAPSTALIYASVAQLVEQRTENPRVVGSIPTGGTIPAYPVK